MCSPTEDLVAAGLRALAEQDKIPPAERFAQMVQSGIIDECGRVNYEPDGGPEEIPLSELRARLGLA